MKPIILFKTLIVLSLCVFSTYTGAAYDYKQLQPFTRIQDHEQTLAYLSRVLPSDDVQYLLDLGYANYEASLPAPQLTVPCFFIRT
ncbi:hypothetical protein A8C56_17875 [Niabella ginsenosidivorans]|uniref:Uncharacterized protein n=1 Tax=Niabella ginsenosidivorans TaxID=1176587 RepID=A0A1A9I4W3_9BACT|nr:hypothetical protein [Niabella ginsenosidivorans]ANH82593.1 hypothetical protein A8C56_17875 [Niabella ginsenosidivorans]